jgi:hypothetical protein
LYEFVAKGVRNRGIAIGMQYFLIVISNNQLNTEWGNRTAASPNPLIVFNTRMILPA